MASKYWEHRAALRQAAYDRANNHTVATVSKAFDALTEEKAQAMAAQAAAFGAYPTANEDNKDEDVLSKA